MEIFVNNIILNMYSNKSYKSTHPNGQWGWGEERHHRECDLEDFVDFHRQESSLCVEQLDMSEPYILDDNINCYRVQRTEE